MALPASWTFSVMERILLWFAVFYLVTFNSKQNLYAEKLIRNDYISDSASRWENPNVQCNQGSVECRGNYQAQNLFENTNIQSGHRGQNQWQSVSGNKRNIQPGTAQRVEPDYGTQQRLPTQVNPDVPPRSNNVLPLANRGSARPAPVAAAAVPGPPAAAAPHPLALAGKSEGQLATTFMAEIGAALGSHNFVISPFGIWTIVVIVFGVAGGRTATELANLLGVQGNSSALEAAYSAAFAAIQKNTKQVESKTLNMVARRDSDPLKPDFAARLNNIFNAEVFSVNFYNPVDAARAINNWASSSTKSRIKNISTPDDFDGLRLLLGSASFFKGRWRFPFNETATFSDEFKDESDTLIGNVAMMRSREMYKYGYSSTFDSQVIELPYGDGETSMLVFLPRRKVSVQDVLNRMKGLSLAEIIPGEMAEEEVDLSFPRFSTSTRVALNQIFVTLKAGSMLNPGAELPGLSDQNFISRVSHTAEIETSEQGTTASAITSAQVSYKVSSASFHANRPFIYFINHTPSRLVLFAGQYCKP